MTAATRKIGVIAWLRTVGRGLLDLLYPPRCPGCGRIGVTLCAECQSAIEPLSAPICVRCGRPAETEGLCTTCERTPSHLDRISATAVFAHPLREAIHELKYNNNRTLAQPLGDRMAAFWQERRFAADLIIPVPLHHSREAERGYNQAALLARVLGSATGVHVTEHVVARRKATRQQALLNAAERRENVKDAFVCRGDVAGKRIVLVDDVCTTGSTLEACAQALKMAGAESVWAFTLARARWEPGQPAPDAKP